MIKVGNLPPISLVFCSDFRLICGVLFFQRNLKMWESRDFNLSGESFLVSLITNALSPNKFSFFFFLIRQPNQDLEVLKYLKIRNKVLHYLHNTVNIS